MNYLNCQPLFLPHLLVLVFTVHESRKTSTTQLTKYCSCSCSNCKRNKLQSFVNCCGASVASEQQHNQDLKRIYKREYAFSNSSLFTRMYCTFYQNALYLIRVHCATNSTKMSYRLLAWIPVRNFALIYL